MVSGDLSFIIPPISTMKSVKEAISAINSQIDDPDYLNLYEKEPLFVMPVHIDVGENRLDGYAYYDQKREQQEKSSFCKRLYDLMERLKAINLKPWMNPEEVFIETAKKDARFIEWKAVDCRLDTNYAAPWMGKGLALEVLGRYSCIEKLYISAIEV